MSRIATDARKTYTRALVLGISVAAELRAAVRLGTTPLSWEQIQVSTDAVELVVSNAPGDALLPRS